jgi:hypothetical protein
MANFKIMHPAKVRDFIYILVGLTKGLLALGKTLKLITEWIRELDCFPFEF